MADKKLFELELGTPTDSDLIAYGKTGSSYKNISVGDFKTLVEPTGTLKTMITEIGDWNMNTTASKLVTLNGVIPPGGFLPIAIPPENIRGVDVIIINDAGLNVYDFIATQNGTTPSVPLIQIAKFTFIFVTTTVTLYRANGGWFDSADFQNTGYNRGWITVNYVDF